MAYTPGVETSDQPDEAVVVGAGGGGRTASGVSNLFNLGRHKVRAQHYRDLRMSAFAEWGRAVA